ncbi:MAG: HEAT repeat domain-containing protein [Spirochaetales bacterium]|nr:HEAT repeat domain-containing protein [Spirochaetales bacterium]
MKKRALSVFLIFVFAAVAQSGYTQERELTIEELYLQNAEIRIIREQAVSQDRDMKLLALENIQGMLDDGKLSTGAPEAHFVLDYLSGEGLSHTVTENRRLINYYPEVRRQAVNLLGQLGGENSQRTLVSVLYNDIEPMVMAEAAYALGQLGDNEDNAASRAIANVILFEDYALPDNNLAFASLLAFEKLAAANGGLNDPAAFEAIIRIAQGNYIRKVRLKAVQVLDSLRQY